jgi:methyl-accepting chemotaxis protein
VDRIDSIQVDASGAAAALAEIRAFIHMLTTVQDSVSSAIESHRHTASGITGALDEGVRGTREISSTINEVANAAVRTSSGASATKAAAATLARQAVELKHLLAQFLY